VRRVVLVLGFAVALMGQLPGAGAPDLSALDLLSRIKIRAAENLMEQPNYTCHETIERAVRPPGSGTYRVLDTIQLEVALIQGRELFSRPGAAHFEDAKITDIVTAGTIANGNFALHARAIFLSDGPLFQYRGMAAFAGRASQSYDYSVTRANSGWEIKVDQQRGFVGYRGSFHVDSVTLDLKDLTVETVEIPPNLRLRRAYDRMEYQRVAIGNSEFLLPRSSEMIVTSDSCMESRNRTLFHACRQYAGESVLTFDEAPDSAPDATLTN
jgi:hypothetical protein